MKLALAFLLLAAAIQTPAQEKQKEPPKKDLGAAHTVTGLENIWVVALVKGDTAVLADILADTYSDSDEHANRTDKQGVLGVLKSGDLKFKSIELSDMEVQVYGDAAVVTGRATQSGTYKGQPLTSSIIFTDTFIRQGGKWRAVASHRSAA